MANKDATQRVLVLITAQETAAKLLDYGFSLAKINQAELHALHIQKDGNVFQNNSSLQKLQSVINHGAKLGASIHLECQNDIAGCIGGFVRKEGITHVVLGDSAKGEAQKKYNEKNHILDSLPGSVSVYVFSQTEQAPKDMEYLIG